MNYKKDQIEICIKVLESFEKYINNSLDSGIIQHFKFKRKNFSGSTAVLINSLENLISDLDFVTNNYRKLNFTEDFSSFIDDISETKECLKIKSKTELNNQIVKLLKLASFLLGQYDCFQLKDIENKIRILVDISNQDQFNFNIHSDQLSIQIEKLEYFVNLFISTTVSPHVFEGLPVEPPFKHEKNINQRVISKDLRATFKYALDELLLIQNDPNAKIRIKKLLSKEIVIQVGAKSFYYINDVNWQGWIYNGKPSKKIFKDLLVYEIPGIISGLVHDLRNALKYSDTLNKTFEEALSTARKERAAVIDVNVQHYSGWPIDERAFKTLKSRYKGIILGLFASLVLFIIIGFYIDISFISPFVIIDTTILWTIIIMMGYLVYLCINGFVGHSGSFRINKNDIIDLYEDINIRRAIGQLNNNFGSRFSENILIKNHDNVETYCSLLIRNLQKNRKIDLIRKYELFVKENYSNDAVLIEIIVKILEKQEKSSFDKQLINEIFPLQLIIIPAVNDVHVVELINNKVKNTNYPNTIFLLALEERDIKTVDLINNAIANNEFADNVFPYFGPIELSNFPGQQRKPRNKPKNVNKTFSHFLAGIDGLFDIGQLDKRKPDYVMIWDLEDDPGSAQLWSMIVANITIQSTISDIFDIITNNGGSYDLDKLRNIKTQYPEVYKNVKRFGIDLLLISRLLNQYRKVTRKLENSLYRNNEILLNQLIQELKVNADIDLLENLKNQKDQILHKEGGKYTYEINIENYKIAIDNKIAKLHHKYSSENSYIKEEFTRRTMPADTQGILVARMYGESPMSHLEWVLWFDLILPGLMRFKFDYTIIPGIIIGAIYGGITGGVGQSFLFAFLGFLAGFGLGEMLIFFGIDTRNKVGLSFSAGTTNNFHFDTLVDNISLFPEYNVAEDWSIALRLAKYKCRSLLINGYNTPTFEDSLAPLGPRMWAQHSRWMGGHFQSFPQIFIGVRKAIQQFNVANWIHSFFCFFVLSIAPLFTAYAILKSLFAVFIKYMFELSTSYFPFFSESLYSIKIFFSELTWWIPDDGFTGLILILTGPLLIIILGTILIIRSRPDDRIMVKKSIEDLTRQLEEYENNKNPDIERLKQDILYLQNLANSFENVKGQNEINIILQSMQQKYEMLLCNEKIGKIHCFWDDPGNFKILIGIIKHDSINCSNKLMNLADLLNIKLNEKIDLDIKRLKNKIKKCDNGELNLGFSRIRIGQYPYAIISKHFLNFGMVYYYLHTFMSVFMYFGQMNKEMDSMWRQTGHRLYGKSYFRKLRKELKIQSKRINK